MQPLFPRSSRDPFQALRHEINDLFSSFSSFPSRAWGNDMSPRLDVSETDQQLNIDEELPGFDEKDVEVTLAGDRLTIRGERKNDQEEKGKNYHLSERRWAASRAA